MGLVGLFASAFIIGLSGAMAPGSLLAVGISEALRSGFWAGPLITLGHALLELVMVILLLLGLGQILSYSLVLGVIGLLGGVMLLWFARATWSTAAQSQSILELQKAGSTLTATSTARITQRDCLRIVGAGVAASIANPYWILWWATVGAAYVAAAVNYGPLGTIIFYGGHIASDFAWYSLVAWTVASGKKLISDRLYRNVMYVCSGLLFLLACYFLQLGLRLIIIGN